MSKQNKGLTLRQSRAVTGQLTSGGIAEAARRAGVGERTIYRWLTDDTFRLHLFKARRLALSRAIARLHTIAEGAVDALDALIHDEKVPASSRVSAVRTALRFACHGAEIEDFEERLSSVERTQARMDEEKGNRSGD
jgi:hypothetical protein